MAIQFPNGRFQTDRLLGTGGFASVWLVTDTVLRAPAAVKVLADNWSHHADVRERFLEEARILRQADDERLVRVLDFGELADGRPYFVMSYCDGGSLADRNKERRAQGGWPLQEALDTAARCAECAAAVHELGYVHRDLKPANFLYRTARSGARTLVLGDLGLARSLVSGTMTLASGTPGYMAPEQAAIGDAIDERTDVYALGVITYELLGGRLPYQISSLPEVTTLRSMPVPDLRQLRPDLPGRVGEVVRAAISPDAAGRPATAVEFRRALLAAPTQAPQGPGTVVAPPPRPATAEATAFLGAAGPPPVSHPPTPPPSRPPTPAPGGAPPVPVAGPVAGQAGPVLVTGEAGPVPLAGVSPPPAPKRRARRWVALIALFAVAVLVGLGVLGAIVGDGRDAGQSGADTTIRRRTTTTDAVATSAAGTAAAPAGIVEPLAGCPVAVGFVGPLSGDFSALAEAAYHGAEIAVDEHNQDNPGCTVELVRIDTQGTQEAAAAAVARAVERPNLVGVVGMFLTVENEGAGQLLQSAGVPWVSLATDPTLAERGWTTFHRSLANDTSVEAGVAQYVTATVQARRVAVVDDGSPYGRAFAAAVTERLGTRVAGAVTMPPDTPGDDTAFAREVAALAPDAVVWAGFADDAGTFVTAFRAAGVRAPFVAGDGGLGPGLLTKGGEAAEGAVVVASPAPADVAPRFERAYRRAYDSPSGFFSLETYVATRAIVDAVGARRLDRAGVQDHLSRYDATGPTGRVRWGADGELLDQRVWLRVVEGGRFASGGKIDLRA